MVRFDKYKPLAPAIVRIGLGLVFLWFGLTQIFNGQSFLGYLPSFAEQIPLAPLTIILLNGILDTIIGLFYTLGILTRLTAFVAAVHLCIVVIGLGYNDIAVRDLGLMIMSLTVMINGPDHWTFDTHFMGRVKNKVKTKSGFLGDAMGIKIKLK